MKLTNYKEKLSFLNLGVQSDFIDIRAAGVVYPDENYKSGDIPSGYTLIEFILDGRARVTSGGETREPTSGDLMIIRQGDPVIYECDPEHPQHKLWIDLRGRYPESLFSLYSIDSSVSIVNAPGCRVIMESMVEFVAGFGIHENKLCHMLFDLLYTAYADRSSESAPPLCEQIRSVLDRHIEKPVKVSDIASYFCRSSRHIERIFEQEFGITIYRYLRDCRFDAACRELRRSDEYIYVIAERFQLGSPGFFADEFYKRYGVTPKEYRRRFRNGTAMPADGDRYTVFGTIYDSLPVTAGKKSGT